VDADLDTLATALYVRVDDLLVTHPVRAPWRPEVGIAPKITDAELVTLAVMAALLDYTSEAPLAALGHAQLSSLFPYLPQQPGCNKRLRALAGTVGWLIGMLARDTSLYSDDVWLADSTPVECGRILRDLEALRAGRVRRVRLLRQPLPLLLGAAAAPAVYRALAADRVRAHRRQGRRTRHAAFTSSPIRHCLRAATRRSSPTRTTTAASSKPPYPSSASPCYGQLARANATGPARGSSNRYGRSSNRSTTPSKASSTSNSTVAAPSPACSSASGSDYSP
jgi:hypothetical protein